MHQAQHNPHHANNQDFWGQVYSYLFHHPPRTVIRFYAPYHPQFEGAVKSTGLNVGQLSDWRVPPDVFKRGLHVQQFSDGSWAAHIDKIHPEISLIGHLREDAPQVYKALTTGAGALLSKALGGSSVAGAVAGWIIGAFTQGDGK